MKNRPSILLILPILLLNLREVFPACLTSGQLTSLGFELKADAAATEFKTCKTVLSASGPCVDPGKISKILIANLTDLKQKIDDQIKLTIDNFWNVMGRWNRLYTKIKEYKANNKWTVKHIIITTPIWAKTEATFNRYFKVGLLFFGDLAI